MCHLVLVLDLSILIFLIKLKVLVTRTLWLGFPRQLLFYKETQFSDLS